jgi:hypothetical protein
MGPNASLSAAFVAELVKLDRDALSHQRRSSFVDAWTLFTNAVGAYTPYVQVAPRTWVLGHQPDGTHLTASGAAAVDAKAVALLTRLLRDG